ncbi:MAG: VOC family protein [Parasphingorhabdus sp.]
MKPFRLRQLVIACESQDSYPVLQDILSLGQPFHDQGVSEFGLHNAVFALGDQFLEIVVPVSDKAPAKRFIERSGEGGYMAIFQTNDIAAARQQAEKAGIRSVWNIDLDDISATHLHPADIGGAIVSIDQANPAESWRWGGKNWENQSTPGRLTGAVCSSPDPEVLSTKWAAALGLETNRHASGYQLDLDAGQLLFVEGEEEKMQQFHLATPDPAENIARAEKLGLSAVGNVISFAGVSLKLEMLAH